MTYKSPTDGSAVTRTVRFELRGDDERFLLMLLEHAREGAMPFSQRAIDRIRDAITAPKQPHCNTKRPWEAP